MNARLRLAVHVALVVLLTVAAYHASPRGEFVSDDAQDLVENARVHSLTPANLHDIFTSREQRRNYVPLTMLSFAVEHRLWGLDPIGYHVVNLALHAANALLVYALLRRLRRVPGLALGVALLWALHPLQVESVAWISERKNVLSTFFFLLAFLSYLRFSERPRLATYVLVLALFTGALLSKVNTIVLPALMVGYELTERFRLRARDLVAATPLLAIGGALAWVNLADNRFHGAVYHGGSFLVTMKTSASVVPRYLGLVGLPRGLSFFYGVPLKTAWTDSAVLTGLGIAAALAGTALLLATGRRRGAFWILWFGVTLAPMLNLVPFPALMQDRYLYLPLLGLLALVADTLHALGARVPVLRRATPPLAVAGVAACAWLTAARVPVFHDDLSLFADTAQHTAYGAGDAPGVKPSPKELTILHALVARDPTSPALHNNLGAIAFEEGRLDDALPELERARELAPDDPVIAVNLGRAYLHAGRIADAERTLEDAVRLESPSYYAHLNLARIALLKRDLPRTRTELETARRINPDYTDSRPVWTMLERLERAGRAAAAGDAR